jgi:hypothetical protein
VSREADFLRAIGWADLEAGQERAELTGESLFDAMVAVSLRHAEWLRELGPVGVLELDPCPRCGGTVLAGETEARCAAGCGWRYRDSAHEPLASRRADA